jgi:hypothetical protein
MMKMLFFPSEGREWSEQKRRTSSRLPRHIAISTHFPHETLFLCSSYVFIYVGFFLFCCSEGVPFKCSGPGWWCEGRRKREAKNFFSRSVRAWILSIFLSPSEICRFAFHGNFVMDFSFPLPLRGIPLTLEEREEEKVELYVDPNGIFHFCLFSFPFASRGKQIFHRSEG